MVMNDLSIFPADIAEMSTAQLASLPTQQLYEVDTNLDQAIAWLKSARTKVDAALDQRFGAQGREALRDTGRDFGTAHLKADGLHVKFELPKKVSWDQKKLKAIAERITSSWRCPSPATPTGHRRCSSSLPMPARSRQARPPLSSAVTREACDGTSNHLRIPALGRKARGQAGAAGQVRHRQNHPAQDLPEDRHAVRRSGGRRSRGQGLAWRLRAPATWPEFRDLVVFLAGPNPALPVDAPYSKAHFDHVCERYGDPAQLAKYDTYFVDSITVLARLALIWAKVQPQALSERTGKPDTRGAYGLLGQEMLTH
jgi:hypothetical protein